MDRARYPGPGFKDTVAALVQGELSYDAFSWSQSASPSIFIGGTQSKLYSLNASGLSFLITFRVKTKSRRLKCTFTQET